MKIIAMSLLLAGLLLPAAAWSAPESSKTPDQSGAAGQASANPARAESGGPINLDITEFDLPNGLHVILSEDHRVPVIDTNIMYNAGSANETKGRTGFAHLFEHLMFGGSAHVGKGQFEKLIFSVHGRCNASTREDYTEYFNTVPSNALPMVLFLESDRMGYYLDSLRPGIVDEQRDVVINEILESPSKGQEAALAALYPPDHPYSWRVYGSQEDLNAAAYEDVVNFYKANYAPGNASLAVVGDFDTAEAKKMIEHWFSDVPQRQWRPLDVCAAPAELNGVVKKTVTDEVPSEQRILMWSAPAKYQDGDAALEMLVYMLGGSFGPKNSRLYKRLIDGQYVSSVYTLYSSCKLGSYFCIRFSPKPGHTLDEVQSIIDEELERVAQEPPAQKEVDLSCNYFKNFIYDMIPNNNQLAEQLNLYYWAFGRADGGFDRDLERFRRVTPEEISACAKRYLSRDKRVEITVVPERKKADSAAAAVIAKEEKP